MNITELDSFNLADAVKFHDRLNPRLWDRGEHLQPQVRDKLLEIAKDFQEFLGVPDLDVKDITISGSNAAYNYTKNSDIDLHLVVDLPEADNSEVYRELFDAKKFQYNNTHNIKINGCDVELYVQNPHETHHSQGIYSLLKNGWVSVPKRRKAEVDDISTKSKYEDLAARIDNTIRGGQHDQLSNLMKKIKSIRQSGLEQNGEFSSDNLAFKLLRNNGYIKRLVDARNAARDVQLSLAELAKPKQRVTYGYVSESPDGVNPSTKMFLEEPMDESPDGVNPSTKMFLEGENTESVVQEFILDTAKRLGITKMPKILIHHDEDWSEENHSFGMYVPERHELHVSLSNRHLLDVLRTTAHELCHCAQHQIEPMPTHAGYTGSPWENEAHAVAGIIMRDFAEANPHYFQQDAIKEGASGYIPKNKKEAKDPRWAMGLSVDIKPGQVGKEANKLALNTGRNGEPGLLMKSANLRESRMPQPSQGQGKYRDLNAPLGPEFKPTMPKGTVRVDVSDVYDWYKLGKHIPNLDRASASEFGKGPPSTIVSFGDEDTEHKYIKNLEKLGLSTTDIDPVDPNQPKGMKRQKTDPTYNVAENELAESLLQELELFEEDLMEIKMTSKNLAQLAKDIPGVTVGLEFEMIVPNTESDTGDLEPDYEQDERVRDIDDCVNFFDDGDFNDRSTIRRLRDDMYNSFYEWRQVGMDEAWDNNGFEFFCEYLDREEPFEEEEYLEQAIDIALTNNPNLQSGTEEYDDAVREALAEINSTYYTETWESQGRSYDNAREEFDQEQEDNFTESDWLDNEGIRYASDVENNYNISWPHYAPAGGGDTDVKTIALNFMNYMGYNTIAVGDYHGYGGGYQLWNGDDWVKIGSNKPLDAFTIEPDGSLSGNDSEDAGLEFVSPPIPLDQIGETMKRVQQWAGENGVYTGKNNKTSMHTNISIPGYDLDKLDYLKAAILLGDEHVLRQFGRIGNTYAKPAINKVKELVKQKPEKAKELLDKMKSHLDAAASKLIHSGVTDKYTSINTKDNRIEYRSPGGDYLSDIADDPQKMIDTINRMVVNIDAAMDPNKYKEEYQKKLYKVLTGQAGGREAKTGAKQETPKDTKDLLNLFAQYSAGELPKQALKSFVRQAQTARKLSKIGGTFGDKYWWNVRYNGQRMEVVATSEETAKMAAAKEWGIPTLVSTLNQMTAEVLRPYKEESTQPAWGVWDTGRNAFIDAFGGVDQSSRLIGGADEAAAREAARRNGLGGRLDTGDVELRPIPQQQPTAQAPGRMYKILDTRGGLIAGDEYGSDQEALQRAAYWAQRRNLDVVVKNEQGQEIGRVSSSGEITPTAPTQQAQQPARRVQRWEIVNNRTGDVVQVFTGGSEDEASNYAMDTYGHRFIFTTRPSDDEIQRVGDRPANWYIKDRSSGEVLKAYYADDYHAAHDYLTQWKRDNNVADGDYTYGQVSDLPGEIQRNIQGNSTSRVYNVYSTSGGFNTSSVAADSEQEAIEQFNQRWPDEGYQLRAGDRTIATSGQQSSGPTLNGRPSNPDGNYVIYDAETPGNMTPAYRFQAADQNDALVVLGQWQRANPGVWDVGQDTNQSMGQPGEQSSQQGSGEYGVWIQASERFARLPAAQAGGDPNTLRTFPSREAGEEYLSTFRADNPRMRTDIEIREIPQGYELPPALGRPVSPAFGGQAPQGDAVTYEIYNRNSGAVINSFPALSDEQALEALEDYRNSGHHSFTPEQARLSFGVRRAGQGQQSTTQFGANTPQPMYELVRDRDNEVVYRFFADNQDDAIGQASDFTRMQGWDPNQYTLQAAENYRPGEFTSTENVPREGRPRNLVPTGPGPWEIYRISNGETVRDLSGITNRSEAEQAARNALGIRGEAPELYGVRTRQSDAEQGGIIDVEPNVAQNFQGGQEYRIVNMADRSHLTGFRAANQAAAEQQAEAILRDLNLDPDEYDVIPLRTQQQSAPTGGSFTGEWKVVDPQGRIIYSFGGVGNNQGDANRVAMDWLRRNPRHMQAGVEVLPIMG